MSKSPKPAAPDLGNLLVRSGYATRPQINECLRLQREYGEQGKPVPRLGELLVMKGFVRPEQVLRALTQQRTELRYCPRCVIRVNVDIREDAELYRCSRCNGSLIPAPPEGPVEARDEEVIVVSRTPLPDDVKAASQDPSRKFGKYLLLRELGRGGVGRIDLSWDTYLHQYVALKRILAAGKDDTPQVREQRVLSIIREARSMIRLRHPGIVSVFDVGMTGREVYMSMEYIEGGTLQGMCEDAEKRGLTSPYFEDPRRILTILSETARAVHYAHSRPQPIVHCDLKPANVLIDKDSWPHVLDFGLARSLKEGSKEDGITGTLSYMAPEQATGSTQEIDPRTDIFAFGAILYHLLTGRPPFEGSPMEILYKTINEPPSPPTDVLGTGRKEGLSTRKLLRIPKTLEELCMSCLERERDKRPASLSDVATTLESLHGEEGLSPRTGE